MSFGIISFLKSATANRGAAPVADDNPLPVTNYVAGAVVSGSNPLPVSPGVSATGTAGMLSARILSAATTNATSVKASPGTIYTIYAGNTGTVAFLKLYNKASAPSVGTDVPVLIIQLPATVGSLAINFPQGKAFSLGIAYAITGLAVDTDTTAVGLNQVVGDLEYI